MSNGSVKATTATADHRERKKKDHEKALIHACNCDMSPLRATRKHGGWLNTALPGDKDTIANSRRVGEKHAYWFRIKSKTPLLSGEGTGEIRGWVLGTVLKRDEKIIASKRHYVRLNWGQQKYMPPPYLGGPNRPVGKVLYYYVFNVKMQEIKHQLDTTNGNALPSPAQFGGPNYDIDGKSIHGPDVSGWIPKSYFTRKSAARKNKKGKNLLACCGDCIAVFDSLIKQRKRAFHKNVKKATHTIIDTIAREGLHEQVFTKNETGKVTDYLSRCPDLLSPQGYVNLCYNLPDPIKKDVDVGGLSCDTVKVGTPFHQISLRPFLKDNHVLVKAHTKGHFTAITFRKFVFGAVPYIEETVKSRVTKKGSNPPHVTSVKKYRFGWIDWDALGPPPKPI